jgi:hypothetical protein
VSDPVANDAVGARLEAVTNRGKSESASYLVPEEPLAKKALKRLLTELGNPVTENGGA